MKILTLSVAVAMTPLVWGQGTQATYARDFRVVVVPKLSGFAYVSNPAVNHYGDSCSTNVSFLGDQAAAVATYLAGSATEYVPVSGGSKCGALSLNDGGGGHSGFRVVGWSETSAVNERPCERDAANAPVIPNLPSGFNRGEFLMVNNLGAACGFVRDQPTSPIQPAFWDGDTNHAIQQLSVPSITINGATYTPAHGQASFVDDNGTVVGTVYYDGTGGDAGERPVIWTDTSSVGEVLVEWNLVKTGQANWVGTTQGDLTVIGTITSDSRVFTWKSTSSGITITTNRHNGLASIGLGQADWQNTQTTTTPHLLGQGQDEPFLADLDQDTFTYALNAVTLPGSAYVPIVTQFCDNKSTSGYSYFAGATASGESAVVGSTVSVEYSAPSNLHKSLGTVVSGDVTNMFAYDNSTYEVQHSVIGTPDTVIFDVEGDFSNTTVSSLACAAIARASHSGSFTIRIDYWDWSTGSFVPDTSNGTLSTVFSKYAPFAPLSGHTLVSSTGHVKAQVRVRAVGPVGSNTWSILTDRISFYANLP